MTSELLPLQLQAPFAWPIDPIASDPTTHSFWIAYAAARCAHAPSVEAVWTRIWYMSYVLRRLDQVLAGCRSAEAVRTRIRQFRRTFHPWLPRRCFHPRPGDADAVGFVIAISQIAQTVDLLAEALIEAWDVRLVHLVGGRHEDDVTRDTRELLRYVRYPYAPRPAHGRAGTYMDRLLEYQKPIQVPHAGLPMPWAAGLLFAIETVTGACDTECAMVPSDAGLSYLLRDKDPGRSMIFRLDLQGDGGPQLLPAGAPPDGNGAAKSHPLFPFFGDDLPKLFAEYRAWRALADKPVFQDACKWHPDDEEII